MGNIVEKIRNKDEYQTTMLPNRRQKHILKLGIQDKWVHSYVTFQLQLTHYHASQNSEQLFHMLKFPSIASLSPFFGWLNPIHILNTNGRTADNYIASINTNNLENASMK